jgi:hypothetical protein
MAQKKDLRSSRALDRKSLVSTHASNMRKSIIGHEHHPIRRLLASRMGFPVGTRERAPQRYSKTRHRIGKDVAHRRDAGDGDKADASQSILGKEID